MDRSLFIALALTAAAAASAGVRAGEVNFDNCGSSASGISLSVTACDGNTCTVKKGCTIEVVIEFTPSETLTSLESRAYGFIGGASVPYDEVPLDACPGVSAVDGSGAFGCPIEQGVPVQYRIFLEMLNEYPTLDTTALWELTDSNDNNVVCLSVPTSIESGCDEG